jgi:steroid 5-alpha reductase family enzyme
MPEHPLARALLVALALETATWLVSLVRRDAGVADVLWGPAFAVLAWLFVAHREAVDTRGLLVATLVTLWGLRLGLHIMLRGRGRGEDPRYATMRQTHGPRFWWVSLLTVFWLQGLILWIVALPLYAAQRGGDLWWLDGVALVCVATGFAFEAVGDWQLQRFRADPANRGRVLDRGLWRYTRHPNYFGDALLWWGLFLFAAATPAGVVTVASPLLMTFLLLRVSGVTLLERGLVETRPEYAEYVRRTSAFVPWWPRS